MLTRYSPLALESLKSFRKGTRALIKLHCSCEHELVGISTKFYNFRVKDNIFVETPIRLALKTIART